MEKDFLPIVLTVAVTVGVAVWCLTRMWYRHKFKKFLQESEMWSPGMEDTSPCLDPPWGYPADRLYSWLKEKYVFHRDLAEQYSDLKIKDMIISHADGQWIDTGIHWLFCVCYLLNLDVWIVPHKFYEEMKEATQGKDGFCKTYVTLLFIASSVSLMALAAFVLVTL